MSVRIRSLTPQGNKMFILKATARKFSDLEVVNKTLEIFAKQFNKPMLPLIDPMLNQIHYQFIGNIDKDTRSLVKSIRKQIPECEIMIFVELEEKE